MEEYIMENFTVLNYQGSKNNLSSFIQKNIEPYIQDGKAIFFPVPQLSVTCSEIIIKYMLTMLKAMQV